MSEAVAEMKTNVVKYSITDAAIAEMKQEYSGMAIANTKDYRAVQKAISTITAKRTEVEKTRKEFKAGALEYGKKIDTEAKRVTALLREVEDPLKELKAEVDNRKAAEQAEKERIEQDRVDCIQAKIKMINNYREDLNSLSIDELKTCLVELIPLDVPEGEYQEFTEEARQAMEKTLNAISDRMTEKTEHEKAQEALRKAQAKERIAQEAQAKAEQKLADQEAAIQREKDEEALRIRLEAEAKEKAECEQKEKADREAAEKVRLEKAEEERKTSLPDREKLKLWLNLGIDVAIETEPKLETSDLTAVVSDAVNNLYIIRKNIADEITEDDSDFYAEE